jgi:hypothetical protein
MQEAFDLLRSQVLHTANDEENKVFDKEKANKYKCTNSQLVFKTDDWVFGGWGAFQRTTVLPQLNFRALHPG